MSRLRTSVRPRALTEPEPVSAANGPAKSSTSTLPEPVSAETLPLPRRDVDRPRTGVGHDLAFAVADLDVAAAGVRDHAPAVARSRPPRRCRCRARPRPRRRWRTAARCRRRGAACPEKSCAIASPKVMSTSSFAPAGARISEVDAHGRRIVRGRRPAGCVRRGARRSSPSTSRSAPLSQNSFGKCSRGRRTSKREPAPTSDVRKSTSLMSRSASA